MSDVVCVTLTVADDLVRLCAPGTDVQAPHGDVPAELEAFRGGLRWMRARQAVGGDLPLSLSATPAQVGKLIAERCLPEAVTAGLARVITGCRDAGQSVRIGIDCASRWRDLPWEALPSPGDDLPLALDPVVSLHRLRPGTALQFPSAGPLRILVAISSPGRDGGLDYESELRNVVDATSGVQAEIRIARFATAHEIRFWLTAFAPHVLHLSAHGVPGEIELEDERGYSRLVDAKAFVRDAVPPGSMPPLIVLSACHTNASDAADQETFASELIAQGAGAVVGTETGITDRYATRVFAQLYGALGDGDTDVASALAQARRAVDAELAGSADPREKGLGLLEEWAAVTVLTNGNPVPLIDPTLPERPAPMIAAAVLPRLSAGNFVGRREALRHWTDAMTTTGLVLHGVAGVGKSALAAELVNRAAELSAQQMPVVLAEPDENAAGLRRRLAESRQHHDVPPILVLDGIDGNLTADQPGTCRVLDSDLADLMTELATDPTRGRMLITCRRPFTLPRDAHENLTVRPVPPLLGAEALRLVAALPGLRHRPDDELTKILGTIGGHPGGLHMLNELLTVGRPLGDALLEAVAELQQAAGIEPLLDDLDALPEAADVLMRATVYREPARFEALRFLYTEFEAGVSYMPARARENITRILAQAGLPDFVGYLWDLPAELQERLRPHWVVESRPHNPPVPYIDLTGPLGVCVDLGLMAVSGTGRNRRHQVHPWLAGRVAERSGDAALLARAHRGAAEYYQHHRLVIDPEIPDGEVVVILDRFDLRLNVDEDLHDLGSAMHHLLAAGETDEAELLNEEILTELHACGRWDDEAEILRSLLEVTDVSPARRASHLGRLGAIAHGRGQVEEALRWYEDSLRLRRELAEADPSADRRHALSAALKRIGDLWMEAGNPIQATLPYQEAGGIDHEEWERDPENHVARYEFAVSCRNIGDLLFDDDRPDAAITYYADAAGLLKPVLTRDPEEHRYRREFTRLLQRQAAVAFIEGNIGLARARYLAALGRSHDIHDDERTTADQVEIGTLYRRLGDIALRDGDVEAARDHYTECQTLHEHLILGIRYRMWGDRFNSAIRRGLAGAHEGLGDLARHTGDQAAAVVDYTTAVDLLDRVAEVDTGGKNVHEELATVNLKLAEVALDQGAAKVAVQALERAVSSRVVLFRQRAGGPGVTHELATALERLAAAAASSGLTDHAIAKMDLAISLRDRARIVFDRDDIIYASGRPADRVALNEEIAAARLIRMRISGNAEPDLAEALALLEPLAAANRLTEMMFMSTSRRA